MSTFNIEGDIPDNAQIGDKYFLDGEDILPKLKKKIQTAKRARGKKANGSAEWEFWNGKVLAYKEVLKLIKEVFE